MSLFQREEILSRLRAKVAAGGASDKRVPWPPRRPRRAAVAAVAGGSELGTAANVEAGSGRKDL